MLCAKVKTKCVTTTSKAQKMQCHADDVKNACKIRKETVQLNLVNSLSILSFVNNGFIFRFWSLFFIFYDLFNLLVFLNTKHSYQLSDTKRIM